MVLNKSRAILVFVLLYITKSLQQKSLKDFPEECFTATAIYDNTRVFGSYAVSTSTNDDLLLRKGWYRFAGKSANSIKEGIDGFLSGKKRNLCGAVYPGTLMSTHPTVEEGITAVDVCFREKKCLDENDRICECKSKKRIYVRNCQRHYIYWLVPTARHERYCTSKTWLIKPIKSSNDVVECKHYKTVKDPSRIWHTLSRITSEKEEGWVRFDKSSGSEIASKCIVNEKGISQSFQPCGAKFRGWMTDIHPSVLEGRVSRRVCFSCADRCSCEVYTRIAVRNCGIFFVYYLHKPPVDNARYCGASIVSDSVSQNFTKPNFAMKNICNVSQSLYGNDRLWSNTNPTEFKCDANLYGVYRFRLKDTSLTIKEGCSKTDMHVIENRCTTRYQGFMEGRHPTVSEGYVERIICFQYNRVPCECHSTTVIGVQNCGDTYVYDLKGVPLCDARFCMVIHENPDMVVISLTQSGYGLASNYEPSVSPSKEISIEDIIVDDNLTITTILLSLTLLFLCVFFVFIIWMVIYVIRPMLQDKSKQ